MDEPDAPAPIDTKALAAEQRKENRDNALFNVSLNRVNQKDAFGNTLNFSQAGTDANGNPIFSANQGLGTTGQNYASGFADLGQQYFDRVGGMLDSGGGLGSNQAFDRAYSAATANITPRFDRSREQLDTRLKNQGLDQNSEAYRNAMNDQALQQNEALNGLTAGLQNQMFNQGQADRTRQVSEFQSLTNPGLQFSNMALNFDPVSVPTVGSNPVDTMGLQMARQQQLQQNYQNDLNSHNAMLGGLASLGGQALTLPFGGMGF